MQKDACYNFGFDTVDALAYSNSKRIGLDFISAEGKRLPISCDDLRHHSDLMAEFLRFKGVKPGDAVVVCGLEDTFELYLVLTAIIKLEATVVFSPVSCIIDAIQHYNTSAVIVHASSNGIELVDKNIATPLLKVSVGMPIPKGWRDLHRGSWRVHEFDIPQFGERTADDVVVVEYGKEFETSYTRSDLRTMHAETGWQGYVSSQLQGEIYVVQCDK